MATSEMFLHRAKAPLREILWSSQIDSLPEEMQKNESFHWLMRRDHSRDERSYSKQNAFRDRDDYRRLIERSWRSGYVDPETISQLLKPIANTLLTPILQSRYDEAIDIGIRWRNAGNRQRWARMGQEPKNLTRTIAENLKRIEGLGDKITKAELRTGFEMFLGDARDSADREFSEVQADWRRWEKQTAILREDADAVERELNGMDASSALFYAWMRLSIIRDIHAPSESALDLNIGSLCFAMIVSFLTGRRHLDSEYDFYQIQRLFDTAYDENRFGATRRRQLAQLEHKYGTDDPFESYTALKRPADDVLINLIAENTLVDGQSSPYLSRWRSRLTDSPGWNGHYAEPMPYRKSDNIEAIKRAAAWADSSIKREIGSQSESRPRGWESMDDCVRRIWVDKWVVWVVENLNREKDDKKKPDPLWTREAVFEFIEAVRTRLSEQGYRLVKLSNDERESHWNS